MRQESSIGLMEKWESVTVTDLWRAVRCHSQSFFKFIYLFISACTRSSLLCEGFIKLLAAAVTLSLCLGCSLPLLLLLGNTGSRVLAQSWGNTGLSCSTACEIFLHQGWNLCPLHWQADS